MSEAGSHHGFDNTFNQDAVKFGKNRRFGVIVLADGVSTCSKAGEGAKIACEAATEFLLTHGERLIVMDKHEAAECLLSCILFNLKKAAYDSHTDITEYSSTLACILADRKNNKMFYLSIGDSLIMAVTKDRCSVVAMPGDSRNGCCVTTTEDAAIMANVGIVDTYSTRSVMICSDGAWHLMYNRNKLDQSVREILIGQDYTKLKSVLLGQKRFDDCSFISVDLNELQRRKSA